MLTVKAVSHEFFENYLSFDTRIGRTILPFLFQPGKLVSEFINGKRVNFVNPFRFYLLVSIFFFFVLGVFVDHNVTVSRSADATQEGSENSPAGIVTQLENFAVLIDSLNKVDSVLVENKMDSLLAANVDQTVAYNVDTAGSSNDSTSKKKGSYTLNTSGLGFDVNITRLIKVKEYRYDRAYSDEDLLDSLLLDSLGSNQRLLAIQAIKLYRSDSKVITRFLLGNLSLSMMVLIPGLAFFFLLFYSEQRKPFVAHVIHSLQIHTYSLFIYALALLLYYFFDSNVFVLVAFLASAVYLFFSLKEVYPKSIFSTFWRFACIGILYYFYWLLTIFVSVIISFLLF